MPPRILVLTAPVAEGHLAAARVLDEDLRRLNPDADVIVCDALAVLRRPLRWLVHDAYRWQLAAAPWLFATLFTALRHSRVLRRISRAALALSGSRGVRRLVRRHRPDVIVSTWPAATMVLSSLRLRGKVRVPVCATITDFAGLELWAARGIDLHLVMHESLVPVVERVAGPGSAHVVSPLVSSSFRAPAPSSEARRRVDLPEDSMVVLVSGGGWAVGDLEGAARAALDIGAFVVCLAGRDEASRVRLETSFATEPRVRVLGFTYRMSDFLAAADVLVHSTGGVTCLEALTCGCPVVAYGAPPGHAPLAARTMSALGLVAFVGSRAELGGALLAGARKPKVFLAERVDAASLVLEAAPRIVLRLRDRIAHSARTACALAAALFVLFASDATYVLVSEAHALPESTTSLPARDAVALVVRGSRRDLLRFAPIARENHVRVSVAVSDGLSPAEVATLHASHLDPIPELWAKGVPSWFEARGQLESQRASYRLRGPFYYLAPREGFTIVDYLLARRLGGKPVQARRELLGSGSASANERAGDVVIATLDHDPGHDERHLLSAIRSLRQAGLGVASVQRLASARRSS